MAAFRNFQVSALAATVPVNRSVRMDPSRTRTDSWSIQCVIGSWVTRGRPGTACSTFAPRNQLTERAGHRYDSASTTAGTGSGREPAPATVDWQNRVFDWCEFARRGYAA